MNASLPIPPEFTESWNRACGAIRDHRPDDAERAFNAAARACPEVWIGLGSSDIEREEYASAITKFERALKHTTRDKVRAIAINNIGMCMERMGDRAGAFKKFQTAIEIDKRNLDAMTNMGHCLTWLNKPDEALPWFNRALIRNPGSNEIKFSKSMALLLKGDFKEGLDLYEARTGFRLPVNLPHWTTQDISGKHVMVYCEQGAGDTIQMSRYLPLMRSMGARVSLCVQSGLRALFEQWDWLEGIYEPDETIKINFDFVQRTMSLPRCFNGLIADPAPLHSTSRFITAEPPGFKVGISWGGSYDHKHDLWRSTKLSQWHDLLTVPGVQFYSLQVGPRCSELEGTSVVDLSPRLKNYADTANAIAAMDLVISVDTSIVHLAGSLGKTVWMLTPFAADWRWGMDRTDSPWYPSLTLVRQKRDREWLPVFWNLRNKLTQHTTKP